MQSVIFCDFVFGSVGQKWKAFTNMGRKQAIFAKSEGLQFLKMLGTGAGNGFSIVPNFSRYALIAVFDSRVLAQKAINDDSIVQSYIKDCTSYLLAFVRPIKAHGLWGGVEPFHTSEVYKAKQPLAVLTRATINPRRLLEFWKDVPRTSHFMQQQRAALYQVGIGEYPLLMQATFSIWTNREELMKAAYSDTVHAEIVRKTRERNWYAEELFAEFAIDTISGKGKRYEQLHCELNPI